MLKFKAACSRMRFVFDNDIIQVIHGFTLDLMAGVHQISTLLKDGTA